MAFPGITYDMWCDFEGLTNGVSPTGGGGGTLAGSTHGAAGSWAVVSGTPLLGSNSLEDGGHIYTGDTGVRGMSMDPNNANTYIDWTLPANKTTLSVGFWLRTGTYSTSFEGGPTVLSLNDNIGAGAFLNCREERSLDNDYRQITLQGIAANSGIGSPGQGTIANATWYWVTIKYIKAGTCSLAVYDTSMVQIGSTLTYTDGTGEIGCDDIRMGNGFGAAYVSGTLVGFDDLIVDYTSATFPLKPASGSVARSLVVASGGYTLAGTDTILRPGSTTALRYRK